MEFPLRLRDMTPAWFTQVLGRASALDGEEVTSVAFELVGEFSSQVYRVRLGYRGRNASPADGSRPESLVLKRTAADRPDRLGESLEMEARCYRELAEDLPVRLPRAYFSAVNRENGRGVLLLEDVAPEPVDWLSGPSDAHARLCVAALARMHARFLGATKGLEWIPHFSDKELTGLFAARYRDGWRASRALYSETVPGLAEVGDALVDGLTTAWVRFATPATLLHGDAHAENFPLLSGEREPTLVMLDWAGPRLGSPGVDLGFFIPMSFSVERRREAERDLVAHHDRVFGEAGAFRSEDPWDAYRLGVVRRFTRTVEYAGALSAWPDGMRGASQRMVLSRCAQAAVDLRVHELL